MRTLEEVAARRRQLPAVAVEKDYVFECPDGTWSGYGPVIQLLCATDQLLDLTPLGRQDETVELRHHDKYN